MSSLQSALSKGGWDIIIVNKITPAENKSKSVGTHCFCSNIYGGKNGSNEF